MAVQNPAQAREQRAIAAMEDVVRVEAITPGMAEVQTLTGVYQVDVETPACTCPDVQYENAPGNECKHVQRARIELGRTPVPTADDPALCKDCSDDLPCFEHFEGGVE